jgi:hypothetical protein
LLGLLNFLKELINMKKGLLAFLFLTPLLFSGVMGLPGWWHNDWTYRYDVFVNHTTSLTDYSVLMEVNTNHGEFNSDFSDLRFIQDGNELSYYFKNVTNDSQAWVWVKVDSIPGTVLLYSGNPGATSNSDFNTAFYYSDDFNDNSLRTDYVETDNYYDCNFTEENQKLTWIVNNSEGTPPYGDNHCDTELVLDFPTFNNETLEISYEWTQDVVNEVCNDTECFGQEAFGYYLFNNTDADYNFSEDVYTYIYNEFFYGNYTVSPRFVNATITAQKNLTQSPTVVFVTDGDVAELEALSNSAGCLVQRQAPNKSISVFHALDCSSNGRTFAVNLNHTYANYRNLKLVFWQYQIGNRTVTIDNLRIRKYVGGYDSTSVYASDEPQVIYSEIDLTLELEATGQEMGDMMSEIAPGLGQFLLNLAFPLMIGLMIGAIVYGIKRIGK